MVSINLLDYFLKDFKENCKTKGYKPNIIIFELINFILENEKEAEEIVKKQRVSIIRTSKNIQKYTMRVNEIQKKRWGELNELSNKRKIDVHDFLEVFMKLFINNAISLKIIKSVKGE